MMKLLNSIDGNKTYILSVIGGILAIVHYIVIGDYTLASFIQLSQDAGFCALIAALRHGVSKVGNQGVVTTGTPTTGA